MIVSHALKLEIYDQGTTPDFETSSIINGDRVLV